jgi:hypothetical protein
MIEREYPLLYIGLAPLDRYFKLIGSGSGPFLEEVGSESIRNGPDPHSYVGSRLIVVVSFSRTC